MTFDGQGAIASPVAPSRERIEWLKRWAEWTAISAQTPRPPFSHAMHEAGDVRVENGR